MTSPRQAAERRVFGLDALRASSIVLVLLAHSGLPTLAPATMALGVLGVEFFYALSGFLIGSILLRMDSRSGGDSAASVRVFLVRRWMRTLPLYYLTLVVLWLFPLLDGSAQVRVWSYALFVQNLFTPMPWSNWFGTSWSLVVEEWSYVVLPVLAFGVLRRHPSRIRTAALLMIAAGCLLRLAGGLHVTDWDNEVRKVALFRVDAVAYGVLAAAAVGGGSAAAMAWLRRLVLPAVLVVVVAAAIVGDAKLMAGPVGTVVFFPALGMAGGVLVATASFWHGGGGWLGWPVRFVARISYALYLVHWGVMWWLLRFDPAPVPRLVAYFGVSVAAATVASVVIEQPIMRMRPRQAE